jgi:imidazolonepropionase-like amidohydrolase
MTRDDAWPLVISGATLIDGTGGPSLADATVVIEGRRFTRVGRVATTSVPDGAQVLDARGKFLIPGLSDMHVHVQGPDRQHSAFFLAAGVTTVLDLGGQLPDLIAHRAAIESGKTLGPRLYFTGPFLEEGEPFAGFAHLSRRIEAARIEDEVDRLVDAGAHGIKLYVTIRPGTARRACERAHARGVPVFMHQQATRGVEAVEAGVDCVEHLMVLGELAPESMRLPDAGRLTPFEYGGWMWRWLPDLDTGSDRVRRLFDRMIAGGTALDPTLVLFAARPGALGDDVGDTSMDDPEATPVLPLLPPRVRQELLERWAERRRSAAGASQTARERARRGWRNILDLVGGFHRAGGVVLAGTDCPNVAIVSGYSIHRELQLLVRAGLSPMDALLAATRRPAERLGQIHVFGTIAPGRSADLLVLGADPLVDIRNTRRIERVVARGQVWEPEQVLRSLSAAPERREAT